MHNLYLAYTPSIFCVLLHLSVELCIAPISNKCPALYPTALCAPT
uniref:Uncharacterized protein n=1 Tax=Anguilla anguilla TaxID=7936 RepID=A0A0E9V6Z4_ANGAN